MVFSSLVFLWAFLPTVLALYYLARMEYRNGILLVASLIFYAWGEPKYVFLMIGSVCVNWLIGLVMTRLSRNKWICLTLAVIFNLGLLGYYKYFNFFFGIYENLTGKSHSTFDIILPIGISFFTFQILSYVIDLYRGKYPVQKNIINLGAYISFFPQLIAGPIIQYKDINNQLKHREVTVIKTAEGICRFIYGLGKKVIIANTLAEGVDAIYALPYQDVTGFLAWIAAVFYMLQIYYDFSGYSDMAIGLGKMFGFEFLENFNYPYLSKSIREFWRRWHISLGSWFREYLYIPLGGNKKGLIRTYLNLLIVFFLTGLWHGANWTFIAWGMYHGFFQIIERLGLKKVLEKFPLIAHVYTCTVVLFGWVLFRADNLMQACCMIKRMLLPWNYMRTEFILQEVIGNKQWLYALLAIIGCGLLQYAFRWTKRFYKGSIVEMCICSFILILCLAMLAGSTYNPFIYFRF